MLSYSLFKHAETVKNTEPIDDFISQEELSDEFKKCRTSF